MIDATSAFAATAMAAPRVGALPPPATGSARAADAYVGSLRTTDSRAVTPYTPAAGSAPAAPPPGIEERGEALLSRMTLAEKIGQMSQFSDGGVVTGPGGTPVNLDDAIRQGSVGSVLN